MSTLTLLEIEKILLSQLHISANFKTILVILQYYCATGRIKGVNLILIQLSDCILWGLDVTFCKASALTIIYFNFLSYRVFQRGLNRGLFLFFLVFLEKLKIDVEFNSVELKNVKFICSVLIGTLCTYRYCFCISALCFVLLLRACPIAAMLLKFIFYFLVYL